LSVIFYVLPHNVTSTLFIYTVVCLFRSIKFYFHAMPKSVTSQQNQDIFDVDEMKGKLDHEAEYHILCRWVPLSMTSHPSQQFSLIRLCTLGRFDNYRLHDIVRQWLALWNVARWKGYSPIPRGKAKSVTTCDKYCTNLLFRIWLRSNERDTRKRSDQFLFFKFAFNLAILQPCQYLDYRVSTTGCLMNVEQLAEWELIRKTEVFKENSPHFHFWRHISHMTWLGI
jgi:hypothetical protein